MNSDNYGLKPSEISLAMCICMCYKGEANKKLWVPFFFFFFYALTWTDYVKIFSVKKTFFFLSIHVNKIRPKKTQIL